MTVNATAHLRAGARIIPGATSRSVYLAIEPDGLDGGEVTLYFGAPLAEDWAELAALQLGRLIVAAEQALGNLPRPVAPEPGPDDPTDDPTDEPVSMTSLGPRSFAGTVAAPGAGTCATCGHPDHGYAPAQPCLACSSAKVPGVCATSAILTAYAHGLEVVRGQREPELIERAMAGDR